LKEEKTTVKQLLIKENNLFSFFAAAFIIILAAGSFFDISWLSFIPIGLMAIYFAWQNSNLFFLLLLFSLPLSIEYNLSSALSTDLPDEMLMLLVSGIFIAYWIYRPDLISKNQYRHPLMILLAVSLTWTAFTVCFSTQPLFSLKFLLAKGWYIGAFVLAPLIIFKEKKYIRAAGITLAVSIILITCYVLAMHAQTGFTFATINDSVYPFFRNHVNYSAMLVILIPIIVVLYRENRNRLYKTLTGAAIFIVLAALFFSYARGAWVALFAGIAAAWLIKHGLLFRSYLVALIVGLIAIFWLKDENRYLRYTNDYQTTIFHKDFKEHLIATYKLKDVSTAERFYRWIAGVRMVKDKALTGYGPNSFYYNYKPYAVPAFKTWVSDNKDHSTVHNYFLLTLIEQGWPGLLFLLTLIGAMLYYAQDIYERSEDRFYKTIALTTGVMIIMILVVNFLSDLIETDKVGSLFFLCLSTLIATDILSKRSDLPTHVESIS
jgi:O-antigen ligase